MQVLDVPIMLGCSYEDIMKARIVPNCEWFCGHEWVHKVKDIIYLFNTKTRQLWIVNSSKRIKETTVALQSGPEWLELMRYCYKNSPPLDPRETETWDRLANKSLGIVIATEEQLPDSL